MDLDDGHGTPLSKGSRQNADALSPLGGMSAVRCATYAIRFGDVPLMRISVVPPGPTAVCGTPLEGTLDFEPALGGDIVSLAAAGGSTHAAGMHNVRVTAVAISLDTLESVAPEACTRGAQGRVVRRVRDEMWEATRDTARCTFAFHMPQDATPSFDNGVVRLAWQLEFVFTLDHGVHTGQPAAQQLKWSLPLTVVPCN
jgi:Rgp1